MYEALLDSGDLREFIPKAKGNWEDDKKRFMVYYKDYKRIIEDLNVIEDEY